MIRAASATPILPQAPDAADPPQGAAGGVTAFDALISGLAPTPAPASPPPTRGGTRGDADDDRQAAPDDGKDPSQADPAPADPALLTMAALAAQPPMAQPAPSPTKGDDRAVDAAAVGLGRPAGDVVPSGASASSPLPGSPATADPASPAPVPDQPAPAAPSGKAKPADIVAAASSARASPAPIPDQPAPATSSDGAKPADVVVAVSSPPASSARAGAEPDGLDIDALFPSGGDAPLAVTFTKAAPVTSAPAPEAADIAASAPPMAGMVTAPSAAPSATTAARSNPAAIKGADDGDKPAGRKAAPVAGSADMPGAGMTSMLATLAPATPHAAAAAAATPGSVPMPSDAAIQRPLDLAHDGAWLDSLTRDIARSADGGAPLKFQLMPERLGVLHVQLDTGSDGTAIRLTTDSPAAHAILADQRHQLVAEARAQGVRVSDAQVDLAGQNGAGAGAGGGLFRQPGSGGQGDQPPHRQSNLLTILTQTETPTAATRQAAAGERYA